jgi:hypothetical protein
MSGERMSNMRVSLYQLLASMAIACAMTGCGSNREEDPIAKSIESVCQRYVNAIRDNDEQAYEDLFTFSYGLKFPPLLGAKDHIFYDTIKAKREKFRVEFQKPGWQETYHIPTLELDGITDITSDGQVVSAKVTMRLSPSSISEGTVKMVLTDAGWKMILDQ